MDGLGMVSLGADWLGAVGFGVSKSVIALWSTSKTYGGARHGHARCGVDR